MSLYFNRNTLKDEETRGLSRIAGRPIVKREGSSIQIFYNYYY